MFTVLIDYLLYLNKKLFQIFADKLFSLIDSLKTSPWFITNEYDFYLLKNFCIEVVLKMAQCFWDTY